MQATPGDDALSVNELRDAWLVLSPEDRLEGFRMLERTDAEAFFLGLSGADQVHIVTSMAPVARRSWLRLLAPDDAADFIQEAPEAERTALMSELDELTRGEVTALLAYAEDEAGGLMSTRFARVRPDLTVEEAMRYLRRQAREHVETLSYTYVLDAQQKLLGVLSFRDLFGARPEARVRDVMRQQVVTLPELMDQEEVGRIFAQHGYVALPVVDDAGRMKGIVTIDDIVDVVEEEATEDIQKLGGMAALEAPYLQTSLGAMVKKRAPWLVVLTVGQMLTATIMSFYETQIQRAVVLALFVPLVISSGGNSGSQATTLVIRALALGELRLKDWGRVLWREVRTGLILGVTLGALGLLRILFWPDAAGVYGEHFALVGLAVALSLVGIVMWGATLGAMLPLLLHRLGLDPATASAPFVATFVDVTGLMIYFTVASVVLRGTLL